MEIIRLSRDELQYELSIRGNINIGNLSLAALRKKLTPLLQNEGSEVGTLDIQGDNLATELETCVLKIGEIHLLVSCFDGRRFSNASKKIETKISHVMGRLCRIPSDGDADLKERIENLVTDLRRFEDIIEEKYFSFDSVPPSLQASFNQPKSADEIEHKCKKQTPVHEWHLSFSGNKNGMSINSFLERVSEMAGPRNVTEKDLYIGASDLLSGNALIWYRSIKHTVSSWPDLVNRLKIEYLPTGYELKLWNEIRDRLQAEGETVGLFVACMLNLFSRLSNPASEEDKLQIIRSNMLPYFIHSLGVVEVKSVDDLLLKCKILETNRYVAEENVNKASLSSRSKNGRHLLEPELSSSQNNKVNFTEASSSPSKLNQTFRSLECWNCKREGHSFSQCPRPRNKFCYGCGKPNVFKGDCENCSSGNGAAGF